MLVSLAFVVVSLFIPFCGGLKVPIQKRIDDASKYFIEGNLAKDEGQLKESLSFYRAAVRLLPNSTDYLMMLGSVEFNLNLKEEALKRFNRVLIFEPNMSSAKQYIRRIHDELSKIDNTCLDDSCSNKNIVVPVTTAITELPISLWILAPNNSFQFPNFREVEGHPFIIRDVVSHMKGNISSFSEDALVASFGHHGVDFYPQNMRVKPSKVYASILADALAYISYPEGAYLTVDASEPGAYVQWNMNETTFNQLIQHSSLKALPSLLVDSLDAVFDSLVKQSGVIVSPDELARLQHSFAMKTHWYMLLAGEAGSGMFRHQDTIPVGSWQIQMSGCKKWTICPPQSIPTSTPPVSCVEAVARPGDLIYYPPLFWHETLNLDSPSIALSGTLVGGGTAGGGPFATMLRDECTTNSRGFALDQRMCNLVLHPKEEL